MKQVFFGVSIKEKVKNHACKINRGMMPLNEWRKGTGRGEAEVMVCRSSRGHFWGQFLKYVCAGLGEGKEQH